MSQDHKYTAADFERYQSGKMSAGEMHALEKAAMEDPFLADALEGYAYATSPVKDIVELKQKLFAKKKRKNILAVMQEKIWLRIAAFFILIAGIGYLAYQLNFNKADNKLALNKDSTELKNETSQSTVGKTDSVFFEEKKDLATTPPKSKVLTFKNNKPTDQDNKDDLDKKSSASLDRQGLQKSVMPQAQRGFKSDRNQIYLKGKVVDNIGNPVSYATIKDKNTNTTTVSDSAGRFTLFAKDSALTATISKPGYKTKEKILNDKAEQVIVVENENKALNEAVVTSAYQKQKQELAKTSGMERRAPGIVAERSTSEPLTELQTFTEYVKNNINIPADEQGKNYKGKVILSFKVNKKGDPNKIKVEQSLCAACDKEAMRLLTHGPKWKYTKDQRQVVTIEFD